MELTLNLNRLDLNGDGFVDVDEVKDCLFTVDSIEKGRIPIRALPPDVQVLSALCVASLIETAKVLIVLNCICRNNLFKFDR
jgi:hypothetical protein